MTEDQEKCSKDHDLLIGHLARFEEYCRGIEDRLGKLNELREQVTQDREAYLRNDVYSARHEDLRKRIESINESSQIRHDTLQKELLQRIELSHQALMQRMEANYSELDKQLGPLIASQSRMIGVGAALVTVAALAGGLLGHLWH